jgi:hypothetical protein
MFCPICLTSGDQISERFCTNDGTPKLDVRCPNLVAVSAPVASDDTKAQQQRRMCDAVLFPKEKFCGQCGGPVEQHIADAIAQAKQMLSAKQVPTDPREAQLANAAKATTRTFAGPPAVAASPVPTGIAAIPAPESAPESATATSAPAPAAPEGGENGGN